MKQLIIAASALLLTTLGSCSKSDKEYKSGMMTVVYDCTGTYLRSNGTDYKVCNVEALAGYEDGQSVKATFTRIAGCPEEDAKIICMMAHPYLSYVEVAYIR